MAIDKNKSRELINGIDNLFDSLAGNLSAETKAFLRQKLLGPAFEELRELVEESRPPVLYLVGRSGHGKSSLINVLADKQVAEPGDVKPKTFQSEHYLIPFDGQYAVWDVIDSRGIFETTTPAGAAPANTVDLVISDIAKYKPDVIMHTISAPEVRNLAKDLEAFAEVKERGHFDVPTIVVLTKADALGNPRHWPPDTHPRKAALIQETMDYLSKDVLKVKCQPIDLNARLKGLKVADATYVGIVPVCALWGERWNVETLVDFIANYLPRSALLDFVQAQRRQSQLRDIASSIIRRFAGIASTIGLTPIPVSDILILTPLQLMMIVIVGGLSCRPMALETAREYLAAAGLNVVIAVGLRWLAQQLAKLIPVPVGAQVLSGAIAGSATYTLGKMAEAWFFAGERRRPEDFAGEWEPPAPGS